MLSEESVNLSTSSQQQLSIREMSQLLNKSVVLSMRVLQRLDSSSVQETAAAAAAALLQQQTEEENLTQQQLKQTISELCVVEGEEREELQALRAALQGPAVTNINREIAELLHRQRSTEASCTRTREETAELRQLLKSIGQQCRQQSQHCPHLISNIKKKLDLYRGISNIVFNYGAPEGQVSGMIRHSEKREMVPFSLDQSSNSQHFISNFLWEQLASTTPAFQ